MYTPLFYKDFDMTPNVLRELVTQKFPDKAVYFYRIPARHRKFILAVGIDGTQVFRAKSLRGLWQKVLDKA